VSEPIAVDPAFTAPERLEMLTLNAPVPAEIDALLGDRARLQTLLEHGLRLWRRAMSRTWDGPVAPDDPSFGQKSFELARQEWLTFYQWAKWMGPTLLLLCDRALCEGQAQASTAPAVFFAPMEDSQ
jgi:hypothetical protein